MVKPEDPCSFCELPHPLVSWKGSGTWMSLGRWLLCFPQPSFFLSGFSPQHALNNNNHLGFVYPLGLQKIHGFLKILSKICGLCIFLGKGVIDFIRLSLYNTTYPPFFKVLIWTRKISGCAEMECSKCKRKNLDTRLRQTCASPEELH